ncbi:MAG TPA: S16 family serine protease [Chloroflexota bacterium]|nr:S16 family serine protease [Chloroflexota bacterium]
MSEPVDGANRQTDGGRHLGMSIVTAVLLLAAIAALILWLIPANDYLLLPGQASQVAPMISIAGHRAPPGGGNLYMTDVTLYKVDHYLEELYGRFRSDGELLPAREVAGTLNDTQYQQFNACLMQSSIQDAEVAALSQVPGFHPRFSPNGPTIVCVLSGTPASKLLRPGDIVEAVNGTRTLRALQISPVVHRVRPGEVVHLRLLRRDRLVTVTVRTIASTGGQPDPRGKTALIGVQLMDEPVLPVRITINAGSIGGPSAGLMFALGIVQRLEKADLTHGCKVAGTGTIDGNGNVGPIGGAKQKIIAAQHAGARYFLVPATPDNLGPARANRGSVTVVPVKTLSGALSFLRHLKPCR